MPSKYERELMRQGGLKRMAQKQKEEEARVLASVVETSDRLLETDYSSYNSYAPTASTLKVKTQHDSVRSVYRRDDSKSSQSTVSFSSISVAFDV
jgi:hypothetical protein